MARSSNSPVTYLLRDPKAKKPTPITCVVRFDNHRINVRTGFKVLPSHWNLKTNRVKNVVDATDKDDINNFLNDLETAIKEITSELRSKRTLTVEAVRPRIDAFLKPAVAPVQLTEPALFSFIADFIEAAPNRVNIETGKHVERRTIQKYQTVLKVLREFAETYKQRIDFDTIDLDFFDAFTAYLTSTKGFATNNVGKYLQTLKVFLNDASARGINVKQDYRNRKFKVVKEDADNVYLSESELERLQALDLSKTERLERVRDLFLVGC